MTVALLAASAIFTAPATADEVRLAVYNAGLSRDGPGMLLKDIVEGDEQVSAVVGIIAEVQPDILLLLGIDNDAENRTLDAFRGVLRQGAGPDYSHVYTPPQNAGLDSGLDLDGDGRLRGAADAFGYGAFRGQGGMALLSRFPLGPARDFSTVLWRDLPGAVLPRKADGSPFPSDKAQAAMRLSSVGHWDVAANLPDGRLLHVLANYSSPPVFDGAEDINGLRNHDELRFWQAYLDGHGFRDAAGDAAPFAGGDYILLAGLNTDPEDGDGASDMLRNMLASGLFVDPRPASAGGVEASADQGGVNAIQRGDPALDTADWRDGVGQPGNLRVDYVLPGRGLKVAGAGVFWPAPREPAAGLVDQGQGLGTRHRLVWVDLE